MKLPYFNYTFVKEFPFSHLRRFSQYPRVKVFLGKGCKCVSCGREGTRLIQGMDVHGKPHIDVYTQDLHPLTVDHIFPKSMGGSDDIGNLQPMCWECNNAKGCDIDGAKVLLPSRKVGTVVEELPVSSIGDFPYKKNLRLFVEKGCGCSYCGRVGTRLIRSRQGGKDHINLYTEDLHLMTRSTIVPKSKGGDGKPSNMQPSCWECSLQEWRFSYVKADKVPRDSIVDGEVFQIDRTSNTKGRRSPSCLLAKGTVSGIEVNPHTGVESAVIFKKGRKTWLHLDTLYVRDPLT